MHREPLASTYDPGAQESRMYQRWMEHRVFVAPSVPASERRFSIVMPPPNVTGRLHMGHALDNTLQDVLVRWHRMRGDATLWLPGTDHAGIATQAVVEKRLAEEGQNRAELGRQRFVERVWQWKQEYEDNIVRQLQRLGCSCDWSRQRFTLDAGLSRAVGEVFVRYHNEGLIYRGPYIVNWCPGCATAVSDLEVEHEDEPSTLYRIAYPLEGGGELIVATVRPETMLGDTAVAVHPDDPRHAHLIGRTAVLPLVGTRLRVIGDRHVDPSFGTGALKVTPAHDADDYAIAERHGLSVVAVIGTDGRILPQWQPFAGQTTQEARDAVIAALAAQGLIRGSEPHVARVGHCQRCGGVVEPLISTQWFVRMRALADAASAAVRRGDVTFVPEGFARIFLQWMDSAHDWCISRQLWWGHPIPAYHCQSCGEVTVTVDRPERCPHCGADALEPDPDVLDTWFSSALWPFSTLGWPEETADLSAYYPTDLLVTGKDILFFWVARMVFSGLQLTGEAPFRTVLLHGLVRDAEGRKMSKSLGNGIDPIQVIDQYGADALRLALLTGVAPGNDLRFAPDRMEGSQRFCNKLWNAARFTLEQVTDEDAVWTAQECELADRWIVSRLERAVEAMDGALAAFDTATVVQILSTFFWDEFCDWYLEVVKSRIHGRHGDASARAARQTLTRVLQVVLRLAHPVLPFITEAIWEQMPGSDGTLLTTAPYPTADASRVDLHAEQEFSLVRAVVLSVRSLRAEFSVPPAAQVRVHLRGSGAAQRVEQCALILGELARVKEVKVGEPGERSVSAVVGDGIEVLLPLGDVVDVPAVLQRLERDCALVRQERDRTASRLDNPAFRERAKPEVVVRDQERMTILDGKIARLEERIGQLGRA